MTVARENAAFPHIPVEVIERVRINLLIGIMPSLPVFRRLVSEPGEFCSRRSIAEVRDHLFANSMESGLFNALPKPTDIARAGWIVSGMVLVAGSFGEKGIPLMPHVQTSRDTKFAWCLVAYLLLVGLSSSWLIIRIFPELRLVSEFSTGSEDENQSANQTVAVTELEFDKIDEGILSYFCSRERLPTDRGLILLAFLAGVSGSFLHATQSLSTYMGNDAFKASWTVWYLLRPWIGGVLGFAIYFALRTGLIPSGDATNPHGVVAIGLLGGWFSKTTTDKMDEVFRTLFKSQADAERKDKVSEEEARESD